MAHTSYLNIPAPDNATHLVKSGAGVLTIVCINTAAATETITIYDSLTATGTKIGTITTYASDPRCFPYNTNFLTGLTVVTGTTTGDDITIGYQ